MLIKTSRGSVVLGVGSKQVSIWGESYYPDNEEPYFMAYSKMLTKWDDGSPFAPGDVELIMQTLVSDYQGTGMGLIWD